MIFHFKFVVTLPEERSRLTDEISRMFRAQTGFYYDTVGHQYFEIPGDFGAEYFSDISVLVISTAMADSLAEMALKILRDTKPEARLPRIVHSIDPEDS